jgi:tetratricopeptide (TPR) repeat protein
MRFSGYVNFLLLLSISLPAVAVTNATNYSDAEIKALPPFCEARLKRVPGQFEYWNKILGPDFIHTHHYCSGLAQINRYYRARTRQQKTYSLQGANGALSYMVSHASPTYSLMPDVYLNRGLVLSLMGNMGGAITDLKKAQELNPKLVRAYTLSSDIHAKLKQKDEALAVVADGLRHVPDSTVLQRIYKERGGKLPYPEPISRAVEVPAAPAQTRQEGEPPEAGGQSQNTAQQAPASQTPDATGNGNGQAGAEAPATPKIGSPTNPWCRFCPDTVQ